MKYTSKMTKENILKTISKECVKARKEYHEALKTESKDIEFYRGRYDAIFNLIAEIGICVED